MGRSVAGNILLEVLFGAVVIASTTVAFISHFQSQHREVGASRLKVNLLTSETNLRQNLLDDRAWEFTVKSQTNSTSFACASCSGAKCVHDMSLDFIPLNGSGNAVETGVDVNGSACLPGHQQCYYQANISWRPICAGAANCYPTQAEITINWVKGAGYNAAQRSLRLPTGQKIIKNFPPSGVNAFGAAALLNDDLKVNDCGCGTQAVNDEFKIELPAPGSFYSVQLCQPKGYSPPGQAAYRLTFCGERGKKNNCNLNCSSGYNLIQTVNYTVPDFNGDEGYPAKFGVCENPTKAPLTPLIVSISLNDLCPVGSTEQSSTAFNMGAENIILRICSTPR